MSVETAEDRVARDAVKRAVAPVLLARDMAIAAGIGRPGDYSITCLEPAQPWSPYAWRVNYRPIYGPALPREPQT